MDEPFSVRCRFARLALVAALALGCGNSTPPLRERTVLTSEADAGASRHLSLREVVCNDGAWRPGAVPIDAVLVSACCMLTTDPVVVARGPEEGPALVTVAGANPHASTTGEMTTEDLAAVCATMSDDGFSVFPRPEIATPGYTVSTVSVAAGAAVQVEVDGTPVPGVVVEIDGSRFTVEYVPNEPLAAAQPRRVGLVLTRDGVELLGVILHASRVPGRTARAVVVGAADLETTLHQCGVVTSEPVCRPVARIDRLLKRIARMSTDQITEAVVVCVVILVIVIVGAWQLIRTRRRMANVMKAMDG